MNARSCILSLLLFSVLMAAMLHQAEARTKLSLKKLIKAGLVLGALGSKKLPRVLPIPLPIPVNFNAHKEFGGGHFGNEYYNPQGSELAPVYGHGGYNYGQGGFGAGIYGGGGYGAEEGWW